MAFVASSGAIRSLDKPSTPPAYRVRLTDNFYQDYAEIWRKQAAVRTVVSFLARNIAMLGLHVFERVSDTDRKRVTDSELARLLSRPNPWTTRYRMFNALVHDLGIYDVAYLLKVKQNDALSLVRIAPDRIRPVGDNWLYPDTFELKGRNGKRVIKLEELVYFRGFNPTDDRIGSSPIESLRTTLAEDFEASRMREQILRNGARASGYIERPVTASKWSDEAFQRFKRDWRSQYTGGGPEAGGTPILEDGMQFKSVSQTAEQLQYIEGRKLTREEVASAYFIPPPMIGLLDNATFSNITEQHKMLYQDTLGPWLTMIQEELALQLIPEVEQSSKVYVEFNFAEKLKGSFEEQAAQLQASVGAPWITRNEARARQNLPQVDGGDSLVTPLNVLVGGQASPQDSGSQNVRARKSSGVRMRKAQAEQDYEAKVEEVLKGFFARQKKSVLSRLGAKAPDWWDEARWNDELADDLYALAVSVSSGVAESVLRQIGVSPSSYNVDQTLKFLRAVAESRAGAINSTTFEQIEAILDGDGPEDAEGPAHVFDVAESSRAGEAAITLVTTFAGFAAVEAGKQSGMAKKTWIVTSGNPRAEHAFMDGETVNIDDTFSNGAKWPGDPVLGAEGVANCLCDVELLFG